MVMPKGTKIENNKDHNVIKTKLDWDTHLHKDEEKERTSILPNPNDTIIYTSNR